MTSSRSSFLGHAVLRIAGTRAVCSSCWPTTIYRLSPRVRIVLQHTDVNPDYTCEPGSMATGARRKELENELLRVVWTCPVSRTCGCPWRAARGASRYCILHGFEIPVPASATFEIRVVSDADFPVCFHGRRHQRGPAGDGLVVYVGNANDTPTPGTNTTNCIGWD